MMARQSRRERTRPHTTTNPDDRRTNTSGSSLSRAPEITAPERYAARVIVLLLFATPLLVLTGLKEGFRLPQVLAGGWLGLASLLVASFTLRDTGTLSLRVATWWHQPAVRMLTPLAAIVAIGALTTTHPAHFRAAFVDFAIAIVCVIGWSLALSGPTLRTLLVWTIPPAVIAAALGLDQALGWFGTLDWLHVEAPTARLRITSTLGNPGDLAGLLVLPTLIAVDELATGPKRRRALLFGALAIMTAALLATATLAAAVAILAGLVVWTLSRVLGSTTRVTLVRGGRGKAILAVALILALTAGAIATTTPFRARVGEKLTQLVSGDINALLTGRLDGWRAAWAMLRAEPVTGVGQGAFRAEYANTRLALEAQGVQFFLQQQSAIMATPHNEALSVGAEQGLPGLLALAWAVWCVMTDAARITTRRGRRDTGAMTEIAGDRTLATAGLTGLFVLSVASFPLHVPAIAWPWLLFLAWICRASADSVSSVPTTTTTASAGAAVRVERRLIGRQLFPIVGLALVVALIAQTWRARDRLEAGYLLALVESRTRAAVQARHAPSTMFAEHLDWLDRAARLDPLEIGVPIARGAQYLLLRRPEEAIAAYRAATALEPRPEIDLNLGRALWMRGSKEDARLAFQRAVRLNPLLRAEVPAGGLD
jgi:O-antigen ligase